MNPYGNMMGKGNPLLNPNMMRANVGLRFPPTYQEQMQNRMRDSLNPARVLPRGLGPAQSPPDWNAPTPQPQQDMTQWNELIKAMMGQQGVMGQSSAGQAMMGQGTGQGMGQNPMGQRLFELLQQLRQRFGGNAGNSFSPGNQGFMMR